MAAFGPLFLGCAHSPCATVPTHHSEARRSENRTIRGLAIVAALQQEVHNPPLSSVKVARRRFYNRRLSFLCRATPSGQEL
jgi:hypothetical protein